jgi:transcriptional regulator with XRE-family HTH domain
MRFSRMLQARRAARGLTQRALAKKAVVTPGYIALLETGRKTNPSLPVLRRLAKALGVRVAALLG